MKYLSASLALVMSFSLATALIAHHRPDHVQGPPAKLDAPENVTCPATIDGVLVSWDAVDGASAYQIEYICENALGEFLEESEFVADGPVLLAPEDCLVLTAHVRALGEPKQA